MSKSLFQQAVRDSQTLELLASTEVQLPDKKGLKSHQLELFKNISVACRPSEHIIHQTDELVDNYRHHWALASQAFGKMVVGAYFFKFLLSSQTTTEGRYGIWIQPNIRLIAQAVSQLSEHAPELLSSVVVYCSSSRFQSILKDYVRDDVAQQISVVMPSFKEKLRVRTGLLLLTTGGIFTKLTDPNVRHHPTLQIDEKTVVIGDEEHTLMSKPRAKAMRLVNASGALVVGLTGTPSYSDGRHVGTILHGGKPPVYRMLIRDAVRSSLASEAIQTVLIVDIHLNIEALREHEFAARPHLKAHEWQRIFQEKRSQADREARLKVLVHDWKNAVNPVTQIPIKAGKTMVFLADSTMAERATVLFNESGTEDIGRPPAVVLHSGLSPSAQKRALADFRSGKYRVLCSVDMVTNGHDDPSVTSVYIPFNSVSDLFLAQACGRALRLVEGKVANLRQIISKKRPATTVLLPEALGTTDQFVRYFPPLGSNTPIDRCRIENSTDESIDYQIISEPIQLERLTQAHKTDLSPSPPDVTTAPAGYLSTEGVINLFEFAGFRVTPEVKAKMYSLFDKLKQELEDSERLQAADSSSPFKTSEGVHVVVASGSKGVTLFANKEEISNLIHRRIALSRKRGRPVSEGYVQASKITEGLTKAGVPYNREVFDTLSKQDLVLSASYASRPLSNTLGIRYVTDSKSLAYLNIDDCIRYYTQRTGRLPRVASDQIEIVPVSSTQNRVPRGFVGESRLISEVEALRSELIISTPSLLESAMILWLKRDFLTEISVQEPLAYVRGSGLFQSIRVRAGISADSPLLIESKPFLKRWLALVQCELQELEGRFAESPHSLFGNDSQDIFIRPEELSVSLYKLGFKESFRHRRFFVDRLPRMIKEKVQERLKQSARVRSGTAYVRFSLSEDGLPLLESERNFKLEKSIPVAVKISTQSAAEILLNVYHYADFIEKTLSNHNVRSSLTGLSYDLRSPYQIKRIIEEQGRLVTSRSAIEQVSRDSVARFGLSQTFESGPAWFEGIACGPVYMDGYSSSATHVFVRTRQIVLELIERTRMQIEKIEEKLGGVPQYSEDRAAELKVVRILSDLQKRNELIGAAASSG